MLRWLVLFISILTLVGCISPRVANDKPKSWPLAPLLVEQTRQLNQHLRIVYQNNVYEVIAATLLSAEHLKVSLLSPEGMSLLDVIYDGNEISTHYYMRKATSLPPEKLLADLQFVYWPVPQLQEQLPVGWKLEESIVDGTYTRQLFHNGQVTTEARFSTNDIWEAQIELEHKRLGYRLSIRNF
ncbi:DUF3261 domain-containing protein [Microbulbifer variabilis]|uniref:DUF3261 domain-containing protein n=1 Tax=Microbulbifer variabilis TaxID=266805 RepID=UPI001CFE7EF9|nr:DUF3261 domain-containing protein [Microbulbifer variabilis]